MYNPYKALEDWKILSVLLSLASQKCRINFVLMILVKQYAIEVFFQKKYSQKLLALLTLSATIWLVTFRELY